MISITNGFVYEVYEPIIDKSVPVAGSRVGLGGFKPTHFQKGTQLIENYKEKILNFNKNLFKKLFKINKKINLVNEKNYKINLIT